MKSQVDRANVSWDTLRAHIQRSFLNEHKEDRLKTEVHNCHQGAYENTASYGRRFKEAALLGYPVPATGDNQDRRDTLCKAYLNGLRDVILADKILRKKPPTYMAAMNIY